MAAAAVAGVDKVIQIGGAQAVAALAYGTETIPQVDKITGPGNTYVAVAKRIVRPYCDIDSEAGPSEVAVIADDGAVFGDDVPDHPARARGPKFRHLRVFASL